MRDLFLPTKLHPPPTLPATLPRPHLWERLRAGRRTPVTIVAAPPGFGKTTLIASWLAQPDAPQSAWFAIDADDNVPTRFFSYLIAALRLRHPTAWEELLPELDTPTTEPRALVTAMLADWPRADAPTVLVLEDYHCITAQSIHAALAYLIDHLPPTLQLVFISRTDPPLPLGRWRVRGLLTEIRAADLRFGAEEATDFLRRRMGLSLPTADVQTLVDRTEGWVAGLQLAGLSLQQAADPAAALAALAGSQRYIADYLTDEVLAHQPPPVRHFLLATAILDRFCADLCAHLLDLTVTDCAAMLDALARANLFLIPLDDALTWFRYHHLFADLLRRRLAAEQPHTVADLHRRAATWFEAHDLPLEAVRHWLAAVEPARVAALLERVFPQLWGQPELASLMRYVEALPPDALATQPTLSALLGWTWLWLGYDVGRILPLLDRAEATLRTHPDAAQAGRLAVVRSIVQRVAYYDAATSKQLAQLALTQLNDDDHLWCGFAHLNLATAAHTSGDLTAAEAAYRVTMHRCHVADDRATAWMAACARVQLLREQGKLTLALAENQRVLHAVHQGGVTALVRGWAHINQASLDYELNRLVEATAQATLVTELQARVGALPDVGLRLHALAIDLALAQGDVAAARAAASAMLALAERGGVTNALDWSRAVQARLDYRLGDWPAFDAWAQRYQPPEQPLFFPYRLAILLYIRWLIRQQNWHSARRLLDEQTQRAQAGGFDEHLLELDLTRALLEQAAGRTAPALTALERSLAAGAASGYLRIFIDADEALRPLWQALQRTLNDPQQQRVCVAVLSALGVAATPDQTGLIEPLTPREIEILRLLAEGKSNPQIAATLIVTVETVKTHVKHIYGKLGVADRVSAAQKARALGLVNDA
ncbi:MAG TPA: LuxR family transcriptional regulator [Chloroflexi bacterium]|nr:LuxR family transcriptional regulator [Chloroflexota bacterium]HHW89250.1 AAA family ATPase [Chloroflexota bacterium]